MACLAASSTSSAPQLFCTRVALHDCNERCRSKIRRTVPCLALLPRYPTARFAIEVVVDLEAKSPLTSAPRILLDRDPFVNTHHACDALWHFSRSFVFPARVIIVFTGKNLWGIRFWKVVAEPSSNQTRKVPTNVNTTRVPTLAPLASQIDMG